MLAYITGLSSEVSAFRWELTGGSVTTISAGYALCGKNDKPLQLNPGGGLALGPTSVSVGPEETPSGVINVLRFPEEPD